MLKDHKKNIEKASGQLRLADQAVRDVYLNNDVSGFFTPEVWVSLLEASAHLTKVRLALKRYQDD